MKNTSIKKASMADLKLFLNLFQGRERVFARQWRDGQGYSPVRPERSINADDIALHIRGAEMRLKDQRLEDIIKQNTECWERLKGGIWATSCNRG